MKLKKILCAMLLLALTVQLAACAAEPEGKQPAAQPSAPMGTRDLMANVTPLTVETAPEGNTYAQSAANFAVSLLQNAYDGENCILSPYSVYTALAMSANGADAQTLAQMESVLGMSAAELNVYLYALAQNAGQELVSANSVWFRQNTTFAPNADFLQLNASYYGADIYGADFDEQTLADINGWVSENTDGRIDKLIDEIDPLAVMYLINAMTFDANWESEYRDIREGVFYGLDAQQTVQMMHSTESRYLQDALATGFMKDYAGGQYSFVALLPNEGVSVQEYLSSLSGESLLATIANASEESVVTSMPSYTLSCDRELSSVLSDMGMPDAFSDAANFERMCNADVKIGKVIHKTHLSVDSKGTQAAAVTGVVVTYKSVALQQKTVCLNRPFVMAIYDNVNQSFLFLGAITSVE